MEKWPFFQAATAGLGKYCMSGYGRIGVYRVNASKRLFFWILTDFGIDWT